MIRFIKSGLKIFVFAALVVFPVVGQQIKRTPFDVTNYVMDVNLNPVERRLNATVDVTFTPLEDTRAVAFELNGSLKVDSVSRLSGSAAVVTPSPAASRPTKPGINPVTTATTA